MNTARCEEVAGALVACTRGELKPLERERVRSHLGNCVACATTCEDLEVGLAAARAWRPDVSREQLDTLGQRLRPYMQPHRRAWRPVWVSIALSSAALASVAGLALWLGLSGKAPNPTSPALVSRAEPSHMALIEDTGRASVARTTPAPHLRVLSGDGWDGEVTGEGNELAVAMTRGFAVFAFAGGDGRRLSVSAPDARVEVIGTRFYVEARDGVTRVGVAKGRVRVLTLEGATLLDAGEHLIAGDGARTGEAHAGAYRDDAYLLAGEQHARPAPGRMHTPIATSHPGGANVVDRGGAKADVATELLAELDRAEQLAKRGDFRGAIATYRHIARDGRPAYAPYRDLSRYEIARLWGLRLGEVQRARSMLRSLAKDGEAEVSRQAKLALCELDIHGRPCAAATCLQNLQDLVGESADFQLAGEAKRLAAQLPQGDRPCADLP